MKAHYTVFISYRRDGAFETASLIAEKLRAAGYEVFLDVESLRSGKFNAQLYAVIGQCTDFILILPEGGMNRCVNESDWVRLEILYALSHQKNIVPVMLKGFEWPETMPKGLEGLNEFQSVAAGGHDYFDASIDKLKSYLKSKPVRWSMKRWRRIGVAFIILLGLIGMLYWGVNQYSIPVCKEQVDKITCRMGVINQLVTESKAIAEAWENYYQEYRQEEPRDTAFLNDEIRHTLEFHRQEIAKLQKDTAYWEVTGSQRFLLQFRKISLPDMEAFHHSLYPGFFEDVYHAIDVLELYLRMEDVPETSLSSNNANLKLVQYSANGAYYGYLELLSDMPDEALDTYKELSIHFENLPSSTSLYLPRSEFERLQKLESGKVGSLLNELGFINTEQTLLLEQKQRKLKELEDKAKLTGAAKMDKQVEREVKKRSQHVAELSLKVSEQEKQLQSTIDQTEEIIRRIVEKCKLNKEDEQYTMWGKIVRLATLMNNTMIDRRKMAMQNEKEKMAAKEKGYDVSRWYELKYALTTKDLLNEVLLRLDQYAAFFPDTKAYVATVKQFYVLVEQGVYPLVGMAMIGTNDNLPHPVLQLGDIVIARKAMAIHNVSDYKSAKDKKGDDTLTFLRLDANQQLRKHTEVVPQTGVLIGLIDLEEK